MDKATYQQLDRLEHKLNQCIEGIGIIMQRLDQDEDELDDADEEQEDEESAVNNPPKKEKKVNPDEEYRQEK